MLNGLAELADRFLAEREVRQHSASGRIGQRLERRIELIFNHAVKYSVRVIIVNRWFNDVRRPSRSRLPTARES